MECEHSLFYNYSSVQHPLCMVTRCANTHLPLTTSKQLIDPRPALSTTNVWRIIILSVASAFQHGWMLALLLECEVEQCGHKSHILGIDHRKMCVAYYCNNPAACCSAPAYLPVRLSIVINIRPTCLLLLPTLLE